MKLYNKNLFKDLKEALQNDNLKEIRQEPEVYIVNSH